MSWIYRFLFIFGSSAGDTTILEDHLDIENLQNNIVERAYERNAERIERDLRHEVEEISGDGCGDGSDGEIVSEVLDL